MAEVIVQTVNKAGKACRADCGTLLLVSQNGKRGSSRREYCNAGCRSRAYRNRKAMALVEAIARIERNIAQAQQELETIKQSLLASPPP